MVLVLVVVLGRVVAMGDGSCDWRGWWWPHSPTLPLKAPPTPLGGR